MQHILALEKPKTIKGGILPKKWLECITMSEFLSFVLRFWWKMTDGSVSFPAC